MDSIRKDEGEDLLRDLQKLSNGLKGIKIETLSTEERRNLQKLLEELVETVPTVIDQLLDEAGKRASKMPHISQETVDQVAAASDIVAVIGSYFPLAQAGTEFKGICPFHRELTQSFSVSPSMQSYHCHGCGAEGSVFQFVMKYENIEFPEAVRRLASRAGI